MYLNWWQYWYECQYGTQDRLEQRSDPAVLGRF